MQSWKTFEDSVRAVASLKWRCAATPEHIAGVDFDAVLRPSEEELVVIEVSKQFSLSKVREDVAKINSLRLSKMVEGIFCRGYIVFESEPTLGMIETGTANKVKMLSYLQFLNLLFNFDAYSTMRQTWPFGSALNPLTGKHDQIAYIPVRYTDEDAGIYLDVDDIAKRLKRGDKVILVGDYGTGKSRCIREIFELLRNDEVQQHRQVLAINLRDHWGAKSASEIIAGHLEELGLSGSVDNAMQVVNTGGVTLLLDGLDEVGAQVFGAKKENRKSIRKSALEGVRRLVQQNKGGILITSRSHYFDSDEEMLEATGLSSQKNASVMRCPDEFTENEASDYLNQLGISIPLPLWLPRKPLVFQILSTIDRETAEALLDSEGGEFEFWGKFITAICHREANIHGSLDPETVKSILIKLADSTRESGHYLGRLSVRAVREAYETVIHDAPDEAGEQMLMRLCTLARVSPESPERQFVDEYVVDGLRAEGMIEMIDTQQRDIINRVWKQPLLRLGWHLLYESFVNFNKEGLFRAALGALSRGQNYQAYSEILSIILATEGRTYDAGNFTVLDADIYCMYVGLRRVTNLSVSNSYIRNLHILPEPGGEVSALSIDDCQVIDLIGISSEGGIPNWISKTDVSSYESVSTSARIRNSNLAPAHRLFLAIIHKIFFQSGKGREEKALYKGGYGQQFEPKLFSKIIALLLKEKIIERIMGDDGYIYKPIRSHTRRMTDIKNQLSLSADPLWSEVGGLK